MSPNKKDNALLLFLLLTVLATVGQITIGGITRVTGSGDGCPDWPTCFGKWLPPLEYHALIEYSHRSMGTLVGLIILTICIRVLLRHRYNKSLITSFEATQVDQMAKFGYKTTKTGFSVGTAFQQYEDIYFFLPQFLFSPGWIVILSIPSRLISIAKVDNIHIQTSRPRY